MWGRLSRIAEERGACTFPHPLLAYLALYGIVRSSHSLIVYEQRLSHGFTETAHNAYLLGVSGAR